jgi:hypothetical protein
MKKPIRDPEIMERMRICFELSEQAIVMKRQSLRRENPDWSDEQVEQALTEWHMHRPGAEHGDGPGRPAPWRIERFKPVPS